MNLFLIQYPRLSKAVSGYLEINYFRNADLTKGYFCYNCIYWINIDDGKCMIVENKAVDVQGKESDVIAPQGCCAGYEPNYDIESMIRKINLQSKTKKS